MKTLDLPVEGTLVTLSFRGRLTQVTEGRVSLTMPDGSQLIVHPRHIQKCRIAEDLQPRDIVRAGNGELYVFVDPGDRRPWLQLRGKWWTHKWWTHDRDVPRPLRLLIRDGELVDDPPELGAPAMAIARTVEGAEYPVPGDLAAARAVHDAAAAFLPPGVPR